jgi:excisionase family DNA binding protein
LHQELIMSATMTTVKGRQAPVREGGREWITLGPAARILRVSIPTVRMMVRDGLFTTRKVGYWTRVDKAEVEAMERRAVQPASATESPRLTRPDRRKAAIAARREAATAAR